MIIMFLLSAKQPNDSKISVLLLKAMLRCTNFVKNSNSLPPFTAKSTIGQPFIELTEVGSTNIYAMEQVQANMAGHGTVFFAHTQTAGKGQQGKSWVTEPGTNITMSVVLDCSPLSITQLFELSLTISVACQDFFSRYAPEETSIKWPNDIYWRDRKAGGILIENSIRGDKWQWAVVGIGINLNQSVFPDTLKNPVSLKQITGRHFDTRVLAKALCDCIETRYRQLIGEGAEELLVYYNHCLYKKDKPVTLKKNNIVFSCTIKGVAETGDLIVAGGLQESFRFGEIEWVI